MKSTKRSLLFSALSLMLCFAMLLGTTYAWFTDTATTGVNTITSGTLDVELEYTTDGTTWTPVTDTTKLFNDAALWEPGYTEVAYLRISNVGNLALKYKLAVNIVAEVPGTNMNGDTFKLSDYINMGVVEDWNGTVYADRAAARAAVSTAGTIADYSKVGKMIAGAPAEVLAMVAYMPETVGNEANHKVGTTAPSIQMGVSLVATQVNEESDSFDDTYDISAPYPDGTISPIVNVGTAESLKEAIATFTAGTTIVLDKDIDLNNQNWDVSVPYSVAGSEVTFDGNGHTIKNLKSSGDNCGLFGHFNSNGNITIKNLKLENVDLTGSNVDGESGGGALIGWSEVYGGVLTIDNVIAKNVNIKDFKYIGGLVGYTSAPNSLNITNCTVDGTALNSTYNESGNYKGHVGGIIGYYTKGTMTGCSISNVAITGSTTANRAGALIGTAQNGVVIASGNAVHGTTINGTAVAAATQVVGAVDNRTDTTTNVTID